MQFVSDYMKAIDFIALAALVGYADLVVSAVVAWAAYESEALFGASTAALMLLLIGIHNSWDSIAYHVFTGRAKRPSE